MSFVFRSFTNHFPNCWLFYLLITSNYWLSTTGSVLNQSLLFTAFYDSLLRVKIYKQDLTASAWDWDKSNIIPIYYNIIQTYYYITYNTKSKVSISQVGLMDTTPYWLDTWMSMAGPGLDVNEFWLLFEMSRQQTS